MRRYLPFFLSICFLCEATAQQYSQFLRAEQLVDQGRKDKAIQKLEKINQKTPLNSVSISRLSELYYLKGDFEKAELWLRKATQINNIHPKYQFLLGKSLLRLNKLEEAKSAFKQAGEMGIKHLQFINLTPRKSKYTVNQVFELNTYKSDYGSFISGGDILFLSDRNAGKIFRKDKVEIFRSRISKEGKLINAPERDETLNAKGSIKSITIIDSRKTHVAAIEKKPLFFQYKKSPYTTLLQSIDVNDVGKKMTALSILESNYNATTPFVTKNANTMYFASDMPGGYGGFDLYVTTWNGSNWSVPKNLGTTINSDDNEMYPFINGNVLYFSSASHPGYGGYDIFSSKKRDSIWDSPINMGKPINSSSDDISFMLMDDNSGTISSNRAEGLGDYDIYFIKKP